MESRSNGLLLKRTASAKTAKTTCLVQCLRWSWFDYYILKILLYKPVCIISEYERRAANWKDTLSFIIGTSK